MPIKDVFLPLIGQPRAPALAAIEKCVAVAADLGARITALALEEDVFVRPKVVLPDDPDRAETSGSGGVGDMKPHDSRTENIIETFLFESGRPLLLCPEHRVEELRPEFENVVIAWDHSARAARAVGDALPILQAAASVRVVTVADDKTEAITQSGMNLVHHLREHGVYASFETVTGSGSSIGKVLGSWVHSHAIDAIVMGAYHHSRLNEIVWGGVTKTVIGQPPCWVMISH